MLREYQQRAIAQKAEARWENVVIDNTVLGVDYRTKAELDAAIDEATGASK